MSTSDLDPKSTALLLDRCFRPSSPVEHKEMFAGRRRQFEGLEETLDTVGQHAILFGDRGTGKTSLALVHKEAHELSHLTLMVTCDSASSFEDIWIDSLASITQNISELEAGLRADLRRPNPVVRLLERLAADRPVIVYIDEFDRIRDTECRLLMSDTVKILADRGSEVTLVLIGVADDAATLVHNHRSVARSMRQIHMPWMPDNELDQISTKAFTCAGMDCEPEAATEIVQLAQGLPKYVHALGKESSRIALGEGRNRVRLFDVRRGMQASWAHLDATISEAYAAAIQGQPVGFYQIVVAACAISQIRAVRTDESYAGYFQLSQARKAFQLLRNREARLSAAQLDRLCSDSRGRLLLKKPASQREALYRFDLPTSAPYVLMRSIDDGVIKHEESERLLKMQRDSI